MRFLQKRKNSFKSLIISPNRDECELYSQLIREVANSEIDVKSSMDGSMSWIDGSNYHLVVLDAKVDLSVLEFIKRISPATSVIVLSSDPSVESAVSSIKLGAEDYLKKPFSPDIFKLSVRRGLDKRLVFEKGNQISKFLNLINSCQMISASLDEEKIFQILQSYINKELQTQVSAIYTNEDGELKRKDSRRTEEEGSSTLEILDIAIQTTHALTQFSQGDSFFSFIEKGKLTPSLFVFRFNCVDKKDFYLICLAPSKPDNFEMFENHLLMLKTQVEVTGKNILEYLGVKNLIYIDDLTGLFNTRYLNEILEREIKIAQRNKTQFAVLFLDLDYFKSINDQHGHLVGSKLLKEVGKHLKKFVRGSDKVFRYGGDEFVAVLTQTDLEKAKKIAERIRISIESTVFLKSEKLKVKITVSIGVALYPDHAQSAASVLKLADNVMYLAKKNRNEVYSP